MICTSIYAQDNHLIRNHKLDNTHIYEKLHYMLRAQLPKYLPTVDSDVGIKLSEPTFEDGKAQIEIPGVL